MGEKPMSVSTTDKNVVNPSKEFFPYIPPPLIYRLSTKNTTLNSVAIFLLSTYEAQTQNLYNFLSEF